MHIQYISTMSIMPISLKKQIHTTKILKIIKSYDVVLLFAVFYLPQKNRQLLKKEPLVFSQLPKPKALSVNIKQKENIQEKRLQKTRSLPCTKPQQGDHLILHLHNKSAQNLELFSHLPLSGQIVLFAIERQEDAQHILTSAKNLYKGVFLGGFYKNVYKDKKEYKALCYAIFHKNEIYKMFCRAMSFTNYKNLRTTGIVRNKYICLLNLYSERKTLA